MLKQLLNMQNKDDDAIDLGRSYPKKKSINNSLCMPMEDKSESLLKEKFFVFSLKALRY